MSKQLTGQGEWSIVGQLLDAPLKEGERRFLINSRWMNRWKEFANSRAPSARLSSTTTTTTTSFLSSLGGGQRPGEIDNSSLVQPDGELRTVFENYDYVLINEAAWNLLYGWYGGGPVIKRKVVAAGIRKNLEVDVSLKKFLLTISGSQPTSKPVTMFISRHATIRQMREKACKKLKLTGPVESVKLWNSYGGRATSQFSSLDETIERSVLIPGQLITVDPDGKWEPLRDSFRSSALTSVAASHGGDGYSYYSMSHGSSLSSSLGFGRSALQSSPGLCGLSNLGNTCFMNAGIQCLSNTRPLTKRFLDDSWAADVNRKNPLGTGGQLATAYAAAIKEMWSGKMSVFSPRELKHKIGDFAPQFEGFAQHDCQELLAFLLDGIHEDLNKITDKPYVELKTPRTKLPDEEMARIAWENHVARNRSMIVDTFHGLLKSTVVCPQCGRISITFDPFAFLSLPLASGSEKTVRITLVRDGSTRATAFGVRAPRSGTSLDLKRGLCSAAGLQEPDVLLCSVFNHQIESLLRVDEPIEKIGPKDEIFAFAVHDPATSTCVPVVFRIPPHSRFLTAYTLVGHPAMVCFPQGTSCQDVHRLVRQLIVPFSRITDIEEKFSVKVATGSPSSAKGRHIRDLDKSSSSEFATKQGETIVVEWFVGSTDELGSIFETRSAFSVSEDQSLRQTSSSSAPLSLEGCLARFTTEERLSVKDPWYCNVCKKHQEASKKFDLWMLPDVLIVHLKRFSFQNRVFRDKIDTFVDYPTSGLDLSRFVRDPVERRKPNVYDLFAMANHMGSFGGGHYIAHARNSGTKKWYTFDDSSVYEISESEVKSRDNYVLFFERRRRDSGASSDEEAPSATK